MSQRYIRSEALLKLQAHRAAPYCGKIKTTLNNLKISFILPICHLFQMLLPFPLAGLNEMSYKFFAEYFFGNAGLFHQLCGFIQCSWQYSICKLLVAIPF